jgi:hypothetical protein
LNFWRFAFQENAMSNGQNNIKARYQSLSSYERGRPSLGEREKSKRPFDCRTIFEHRHACDDERIEAFRPLERTSSCKQRRSLIFSLMRVQYNAMTPVDPAACAKYDSSAILT